MTVAAFTKPAHSPNEDNFITDEKLRLFGVFDGVGGMKGGSAASKIASRVIREVVRKQIYKKKRLTKNILKLAFVQAAKNIELDGQIYGRLNQATTATVAKIANNKVTIANVGDSRCYGLTKTGKLKRLTQDHGILEELLLGHQITPKIAEKIDQARNLNELTNDEAIIFSKRYIITRALGADFAEGKDINFCEINLKNFKMLALTTDGIHDNLTDEEIESIISKAKNPKDAAKKLVGEAFMISCQDFLRSKPDDITAVVLGL